MMMEMSHLRKLYVVDLSEEGKELLEAITTKGESKARRIRRAQVLLLADEGFKDKHRARSLGAAVTTVERVRKRFVEEGLEAALSERPRPGAKRKLDGRQEAHRGWGGRGDLLYHPTVRRTLKRGRSSRG